MSALKQDKSLEKISIINPRFELEPKKGVKILPIIATDKNLTAEIARTLGHVLKINTRLTSLEISGLNQLNGKSLSDILSGLLVNTTLKKFSINRCPVTDVGCCMIAKMLQQIPVSFTGVNHPLEWLNLSRCGLGDDGVNALTELVNLQKTRRETLLWRRSLRDVDEIKHLKKLVVPPKSSGLLRLSLTCNVAISDESVVKLAGVLKDDVYVQSLDLQSLPKLSKRSGEAMLQVLMLNRELLTVKSKEAQQARSALVVLDLRGCDSMEKVLIKKITQHSVLQGEFLYNLPTEQNLETETKNSDFITSWMDVNEIKPDSEFKIDSSTLKNENSTTIDRAHLRKLKATQQSLMLEKELRKAAEKRNSDMADELKRLRKENSSLQEDLAVSYLNPPSGKAIVEKDMLEGIETTFDKFNTFLDALARLGVTNTKSLQQADKDKLQEIVDSTI